MPRSPRSTRARTRSRRRGGWRRRPRARSTSRRTIHELLKREGKVETSAMDRTAILKVGDKAPDFTLTDQNGNKVTLSSFAGKKNVVLVFHPLAFTSVCAVQMPGYSKERQSFEGLDTQVLGLSVDSVPTHKAWAEHIGGVEYPLLADFWPHGEVAKKYGILRNEGYSERATFVVDKKGILRHIEVHEIGKVPDRAKLLEILKTLR
ncbi:MAG: peroxiredoxin [Candidatus Eisenbacteria bacterium]|uniref:Alkyl hydroperoxide reductase E n=1 Tax=Eiseniibacteriota bacterium TaxID=2212470 RepID=A0A538SUU9_UNCEI|nr:MAG: peroxiredoxin [Candidatus Eisenbacteria bacterium]